MTATAASLSHGIPDDAQRQLALMVPAGVQALAFTPAGGWVIAGTPSRQDAGYAARGIPDACFVQLGEYLRAGHAIRSIAFMPGDAQRWAIVSDQAFATRGVPDDCFAALADAWALGVRPSCLAFPPGGGWALLAGKLLRGRGVDAACWQQLKNFAQGLRPARQLAFAPDGGWALLAQDRFVAHGLDAACAAHLGQVAQAHEVELLAFAPGGGWVVGSNTLRSAWPADPLRALEDRFRLVNGTWRSLAERMAAQRVVGVSIALRTDGELAALLEYGDVDAARPEMRVFDSGAHGFVVSTCGDAAAALAEEAEDALRRLFPAPAVTTATAPEPR